MMTLAEAKIEAQKRWGEEGFAYKFKTSQGVLRTVGYYYECHCCGKQNNEEFNGDGWAKQTFEEAFRLADKFKERDKK